MLNDNDLVMVLQEQHERAGRQVAAGFAAWRAVAVGLALEHEAFAQAASQFVDRPLPVVGVVAFGLAGQQHVQGIVAVVVPLGVEALFEQRGLVVLVLQHQPDMPARLHGSAHPLRQLDEKIRLVDGMHGVQAQAVAAVLAQPHQGVLDKVLAHLGAAEVDRGAPGRLPVLAEKRAGVLMQVIAVGAEVVVDHVHQHHQAVAVGIVDQRAQLLGAAVAVLRRVGQHAVVAPVAFARKLPECTITSSGR